MRLTSRACLLVLVLLLPAACTLAGRQPEATPTGLGLGSYVDTLRQMHLDRYVGVEPARTHSLGGSGWVQYDYNPEQVRCIDGAPFHLVARSGENAEATLIWLSDGEACWPGHEDCVRRVNPAQSIDFGLGARVPGNPLRDWNVISVPYCDGSLYLGDNEADYDRDGLVDHTHWGLRAISAAVTVLQTQFPDSARILIAGRGAGGYGTLLAVPLVRLQFPAAHLYVWSESGPGLYNPSDPDTWELILDTWNLDPYLPDDCPHCRAQLINLYGWILARDPGLRVGLYSSYEDAVISQDWLGMSPTGFKGLLLNTTERIEDEFLDRFKRYLVVGDSHGVDDYGYQVQGISILEWIGSMLEGDGGVRWRDLQE
jgi:hypothetical protein